MDSSAFLWLSEMELDNPIFTDQLDFMNTFDDELASLLRQDHGNSCLSSPLIMNNITPPATNLTNSLDLPLLGFQQLDPEPPTKLQKPNDFSNFSTAQNPPNLDHTPVSSTPVILSFGHKNSHENVPLNPVEEAAISEVLKSQSTPSNADEQVNVPKVKKPSRVRPPSQTYDHIIAERKRREQLGQKFITLSTIVPGLKKMDKTSVLGDAIKYLKHLQERVKTLEEQEKKQTMESVVLVKKSRFMINEDDTRSFDDEDDEQTLPEIEARVCNNHILLRVHCEKRRGVFVHLLSEIEKLNLCVINTNVTPFGSLAHDITIIAEIENEFKLTTKEVVKRLRKALRQLCL